MKIFKNIKNWVDNKFMDTVIGRVIDKWQSMHPSSYLAVLSVSAVIHVVSGQMLEQHAAMCAVDVCIQGLDYYAALVGFWASLVSGFLSGSISFSQLRDRLKDQPKKDEKPI